MFRGKRISVVMPCHNEEDGIRAVMEQMPSIVDEVVVVDNCSTDRTPDVARELGCRVIFEGRKGYGRAYKTGFAKAKGTSSSPWMATAPIPPIPSRCSCT